MLIGLQPIVFFHKKRINAHLKTSAVDPNITYEKKHLQKDVFCSSLLSNRLHIELMRVFQSATYIRDTNTVKAKGKLAYALARAQRCEDRAKLRHIKKYEWPFRSPAK
jgi:hypothetical protein